MDRFTVEENAVVTEAIELQLAKKPDYEGDGYADGQMVYDIWICPCCGTSYEVEYDNFKYCPECGQLINWEVIVRGEDNG